MYLPLHHDRSCYLTNDVIPHLSIIHMTLHHLSFIHIETRNTPTIKSGLETKPMLLPWFTISVPFIPTHTSGCHTLKSYVRVCFCNCGYINNSAACSWIIVCGQSGSNHRYYQWHSSVVVFVCRYLAWKINVWKPVEDMTLLSAAVFTTMCQSNSLLFLVLTETVQFCFDRVLCFAQLVTKEFTNWRTAQ